MKIETLKSDIDNSVNFIITTTDGKKFEARYVQRENHYLIVYLSSHAGCNMACRMCHLTQTGQTDMTPADLAMYLLQANTVLDWYRDNVPNKTATRVNFNFMARGEPLENSIFQDPDKFKELYNHLSAVASAHRMKAKFNISTIYPKGYSQREEFLEKMFGEYKNVVLYYSMYTVDPNKRARWLPKAIPALAALKVLSKYANNNSTYKRVVFHWALIEGVNDTGYDVRRSVEAITTADQRGWFGRQAFKNTKFNLVRYNPYSEAQSREPPPEEVEKLFEILHKGLGDESRVVPRVGYDVKASCGMFM